MCGIPHVDSQGFCQCQDVKQQKNILGPVIRELREKQGVFTHILAFHELSTTAAIMPELIANLKARGYRFVTLSEYMRLVGAKP